jgi:hypothetical protein
LRWPIRISSRRGTKRAAGNRQQGAGLHRACLRALGLVLPLRANLSQGVVACASLPVPDRSQSSGAHWLFVSCVVPPQPKRDVGTGHQWSLGKFTLPGNFPFSITTTTKGKRRRPQLEARAPCTLPFAGSTSPPAASPHPRPAPPPLPQTDLPASNLDTESRPLPGPSSPLQRSFLKPYLNHDTYPHSRLGS